MLEFPIKDLLGQMTNPPPSPPLPAGQPTSLQPASLQPPSLQPPALPQMTAPPTTVPDHLCGQPGTGIQGQCNNILQIPDSMMQYLRPVGELNGVLVYNFTSALPVNTLAPKKKKHQDKQQEVGPYIKKPPNAFMVFLKEQRPKVKAEFNISGSAAVNAIVGEQWNSLSQAQQAKYYQVADEERRLHAEQHPTWSCTDNYGKKRKRVRTSTCSTGSASKPEHLQPQREDF